MKGFDIVPVLIGLFGIAEVLASLEQKIEQIYAGKLGSVLSMIPRGAELARGLAASARGTAIGFVLGLLPGMLPALTAYLSYDVERQISRTPEKFGSGMIEGVAAPEAANNATAMAGFIPLLSLGIPTTPALAILLGTLMINGLTPGPMLFQQQGLLVWTVIGSMLIANTALLVLNLPLVGRVGPHQPRALSRARARSCSRSAWSAPMRRATRMFDVWVAIAFGIVGYVMRRLEMPLAPLVLGFLLGPAVRAVAAPVDRAAGHAGDLFHAADPACAHRQRRAGLGRDTLAQAALARGRRADTRQHQRELNRAGYERNNADAYGGNACCEPSSRRCWRLLRSVHRTRAPRPSIRPSRSS